MPIVFAAAVSHAPGVTAWPDAAPPEQKDAIYAAYHKVRDDLAAAGADAVVMLTSEHWTNFFFDQMPAYCVGRGAQFDGPVEPWLNIPRTRVPGDPELAAGILDALYAAGINPSFSDDLELDHGTMVPVHFLLSGTTTPVVPIILNTLAEPMPSAESCFRFGAALGAYLADADRRVAVIATGGLSHAPGERAHGTVDSDFDAAFLADMAAANHDALRAIDHDRMAAAGGGTHEIRAWIALSAATGGWPGRLLTYHAVKPWATGFGLMEFSPAV